MKKNYTETFNSHCEAAGSTNLETKIASLIKDYNWLNRKIHFSYPIESDEEERAVVALMNERDEVTGQLAKLEFKLQKVQESAALLVEGDISRDHPYLESMGVDVGYHPEHGEYYQRGDEYYETPPIPVGLERQRLAAEGLI